MDDPQGYTELFELAADAMYILDSRRAVLQVNRAGCEQLGYERPQMLQRPIADFIPPEFTERMEERYSAIRRQGVLIYESALVRRDGSVLPVELHNRTITWNGQPAFFGIARDIRERKSAEQALRTGEERWRLLFHNMTTGFALHEVIRDGAGRVVDYRFLEANPAYERLTTLQASRILGRTVLEVLPNTEPYWIETFGRVAVTGEPVTVENYSRELGRWYHVRAYCPRSGQFAVLVSDVTESTLTALALEKSQRELNEAQSIAHVGSWTQEPGGSITWSDECSRIFGREPGRFTPSLSGLYDLADPQDRPALEAWIEAWLAGSEPPPLEWHCRRPDGSTRQILSHAARLLDPDGTLRHLTGTVQDVTERKSAEQRIHYLANFDAVTGLPNRNMLADHARFAVSLARRQQRAFALVFMDLDRFKDINDTLGHNVGDAVLVEAGRRIRGVLREEDTASRLGGDEFILLLPESGTEGAAFVAERLLKAVGAPCRIGHHELVLTASIGIAMFPSDGETFEDLSKRADTAMYRAKREGGGTYRFFTREMQRATERKVRLTGALRGALAGRQLALHYQPQVSWSGGRATVTGVEALLRWNHPELGAVTPAEFIPLAEDSGLILPVGAWVLRMAIEQLRLWRAGGWHGCMAVNLSALQLRQAELPAQIEELLRATGVPGSALELELTESAVMQDAAMAAAAIRRLREAGVGLAIDDFGTGYSSLSHLKRFDVQKLKIDQSFVRDISTDPEDRAIVEAILGMAQSLGLRTVAEGVETPEQFAFLRERGCGEFQGWLFGRPAPAGEVEPLLSAQSLPLAGA